MELTTEIIDKIQEAMYHTKRMVTSTGKMVMRLMFVLQEHLLLIDLLSFIIELRVAHHFIILKVNETYFI